MDKYSLESVKHSIKEAIEAAVANRDSAKESFLLALYDSLSIKPGAFGVSVDIKKLVEYRWPNIRDRLSGKAATPWQVLAPFVSATGGKVVMIIEDARSALGDKTINALLDSRILSASINQGNQYVELTHGLIAQVVHDMCITDK
jgi:hypothetical protein